MFIPNDFVIEDLDEITSFIHHNAFGQLISNKEGRLLSSHLPFLYSKQKNTITGHLAKINPQAADLEDNKVLVTLQGAHDYISPSWYSGKGVPTWNYQAVHITGHCSTFTDSDRLKEAINTLTHKYEAYFEQPWTPEYHPAMLNAIVGFEIQISDIQCQFKLSQNKSEQDRQQVIEQLENLGSHELAKAMRENEARLK